MSRFFYLARRPSRANVARKARVTRTPHPRRWLLWSLGLFAAVSAAFLIQSNGLATKGYQLEQLRQQLAALRVESRELESRALEFQSSQHLSERISSLNLVPASTIRYVKDDAATANANSVDRSRN